MNHIILLRYAASLAPTCTNDGVYFGAMPLLCNKYEVKYCTLSIAIVTLFSNFESEQRAHPLSKPLPHLHVTFTSVVAIIQTIFREVSISNLPYFRKQTCFAKNNYLQSTSHTLGRPHHLNGGQVSEMSCLEPVLYIKWISRQYNIVMRLTINHNVIIIIYNLLL